MSENVKPLEVGEMSKPALISLVQNLRGENVRLREELQRVSGMLMDKKFEFVLSILQMEKGFYESDPYKDICREWVKAALSLEADLQCTKEDLPDESSNK